MFKVLMNYFLFYIEIMTELKTDLLEENELQERLSDFEELLLIQTPCPGKPTETMLKTLFNNEFTSIAKYIHSVEDFDLVLKRIKLAFEQASQENIVLELNRHIKDRSFSLLLMLVHEMTINDLMNRNGHFYNSTLSQIELDELSEIHTDFNDLILVLLENGIDSKFLHVVIDERFSFPLTHYSPLRESQKYDKMSNTYNVLIESFLNKSEGQELSFEIEKIISSSSSDLKGIEFEENI